MPGQWRAPVCELQHIRTAASRTPHSKAAGRACMWERAPHSKAAGRACMWEQAPHSNAAGRVCMWERAAHSKVAGRVCMWERAPHSKAAGRVCMWERAAQHGCQCATTLQTTTHLPNPPTSLPAPQSPLASIGVQSRRKQPTRRSLHAPLPSWRCKAGGRSAAAPTRTTSTRPCRRPLPRPPRPAQRACHPRARPSHRTRRAARR
jgi:hypothetical protein